MIETESSRDPLRPLLVNLTVPSREETAPALTAPVPGWGCGSSHRIPAVKTSIGHYRVERILGEGGMGTVYAAHDEQLGRAVAIKTIREDQADPASRERLWREARAAAAVTHPNVCNVYEVGEDGDTIYIVMELLTGEPLSDRDRARDTACSRGDSHRTGNAGGDRSTTTHAVSSIAI